MKGILHFNTLNLAGSHYIHLFWSDLPLVSSPFHGFAIQHTPDASKLILTGRGLKEASVREEAEFYIDGTQAGPGMGFEFVNTFKRADTQLQQTTFENILAKGDIAHPFSFCHNDFNSYNNNISI